MSSSSSSVVSNASALNFEHTFDQGQIDSLKSVSTVINLTLASGMVVPCVLLSHSKNPHNGTVSTGFGDGKKITQGINNGCITVLPMQKIELPHDVFASFGFTEPILLTLIKEYAVYMIKDCPKELKYEYKIRMTHEDFYCPYVGIEGSTGLTYDGSRVTDAQIAPDNQQAFLQELVEETPSSSSSSENRNES